MNKYSNKNMLSSHKLRLVTKVAQLYYEKEYLQKQIAEELHLSQATISRLLKTANKENIVKTSVSIPTGVYSNLEAQLEEQFNLKEVIIAKASSESNDEILRSIGTAAAYYIETTLSKGEVLGISSWSTTLLAMVNAMQPLSTIQQTTVVQTYGDMRNPAAVTHGTHLIQRLASLVKGEAIFLPARGVTPKGCSPKVYMKDGFVKQAINMFDQVSVALVGIGT